MLLLLNLKSIFRQILYKKRNKAFRINSKILSQAFILSVIPYSLVYFLVNFLFVNNPFYEKDLTQFMNK